MRLVTTAEMRELERRAIASSRATASALMARAGAAVARVVLAAVRAPSGQEALILVGPGNNGGDGLVVAELLATAGMRVSVWRYRRDAIGNAPVDPDLFGRVAHVSDETRLSAVLDRAAIVVDALFGAGQRGALPDAVRNVLRTVNGRARQVGLTRVAVDIPTGVSGDDGSVDDVAFLADVTVTLGRPKRGLYQPPGYRAAGRIGIDDLGLEDERPAPGAPRLIDRRAALARLPRRDPGAHKGSAGALLIAGGSSRYPSAPGLAAAGALRAGVGLVTLAVPRGAVAANAVRCPEATFLPLSEGEDGEMDGSAGVKVAGALALYDAVQVGNGLGRSPTASDFLNGIFGLSKSAGKSGDRNSAILFDADGLNWLATVHEWWSRFTAARLVLTPHPGEMARLLGCDIADVTRAPWPVALTAAARWNQVVVLKGGHTVVATPDGALWVTEQANPALATAGTGDTLAGVIGGFLAQGLAPEDAAVLGLYASSRAAELASGAVGVLPLVASDLPAYVGHAIHELEREFACAAAP